MHCPACGNELTPQTINHITLHVCDGGCGGLWFNWVDLETFSEPQASAQTPLMIQRDESRPVNSGLQHRCPHCTNLMMRHRFIQLRNDVLVEECPSCAGIWLDAGELEEVQEQLRQAGPLDSLAEAENETDPAQMQRNRLFINACQFLCGSPSESKQRS